MSTDFGLPGRVAIVTGAARGLGAATAELFVRFGAHVVACDIDGEALGESVSVLKGKDTLPSPVTSQGRAIARAWSPRRWNGTTASTSW
mgnify:CR=1 FL=1